MTAPASWRPSAREALARVKTKLFATSTEAAAILDVDPGRCARRSSAGRFPLRAQALTGVYRWRGCVNRHG